MRPYWKGYLKLALSSADQHSLRIASPGRRLISGGSRRSPIPARVLTTGSPDWRLGFFKVTQERARPVFANGSGSVRRGLSVFCQFESYSYTQGGN